MEKYSENRPWGNFEQYCKNKLCTVKILTVDPYKKLSLQYHNEREEFWKIIAGSCKIFIGDNNLEAKLNDEFFIAKGVKHTIETYESSARILEISFGNFDEKDIVRLEDRYGRV